MNKNKALLAGAAMVMLSAPSAQKANAASATMGATAVVVDAISLTSNTSLHFGTMSISAAGTMTVAPAGGTAATNGINPLSGSVTPRAGQYTISGDDSLSIDLNFTTLPVTLNNTAGTATLQLDDIVLGSTGALPGVLTFTGNTAQSVASLDSTSGTIKVGGTITAGGARAAGSYEGTIELNASYQ